MASPRFCSKQVAPSPTGEGFVHDLDLLFFPAPQVTEHALQFSHSVYPPGAKKKKRMDICTRFVGIKYEANVAEKSTMKMESLIRKCFSVRKQSCCYDATTLFYIELQIIRS